MSGECDKCGHHVVDCICKKAQEYVDHLSNEIAEQTSLAWTDALINGAGWLRITSDGKFKRIAHSELLAALEDGSAPQILRKE